MVVPELLKVWVFEDKQLDFNVMHICDNYAVAFITNIFKEHFYLVFRKVS